MPLVAPVLLGMPGRDALEADAQAQPPHGEFAQTIQRMRRGERHAVIGADRVGQSKVLERALEHREGIALARAGLRFTGNQVAAREIGDRQRIAIAMIAEEKLALVVGAP